MWEWLVGTISFLWFGFWGLWLTWPALLILFGWGIWGELDDGHVVNAASTIFLSFLFWNVFDIPAVTIPLFLIGFENWTVGAHWIYLALFFPIGFVWSFRRYKIHCVKFIRKHTNRTKEELRKSLEIKENLDLVVVWVLSWPVGMVSRLFEDIIFTLKDVAITLCKGIYNGILEKALSLLPDSEVDHTLTTATNKGRL